MYLIMYCIFTFIYSFCFVCFYSFFEIEALLLLLLLSHFSRIRLCVTPETAAHQAPLSTEFSRQKYWSGVPLPSPTERLRVLKVTQ